MKYLITESKMEMTIESFLKNSFPEVVLVKFKDKNVLLGNERVTKTRRLIEVVIDPTGILKGNLNYEKLSTKDLRSKIISTVDSAFNLKVWEYGGDWDIDIYELKLI